MKAIEDRANIKINWYNRLDKEQMANCASEIARTYEVLNEVAGIRANAGESDIYKASTAKLLGFAKLYYTNKINPLGNYILKSMTESAIRRMYTSEHDTVAQKTETEALSSIMGVMQHYNKEMYNYYNKAAK